MSFPRVCRVPNESATNLGFFGPTTQVNSNWGSLLKPGQPFGENGWSGHGPRLSACCKAAHSTETDVCLFPGCERDKDSPQEWLLPCRACMQLIETRDCCPNCLYITCGRCLNSDWPHQPCDACRQGPRMAQMTREKITEAAKRCGLTCTTVGCINILLFEDEKDSHYKEWACKHEDGYKINRGPAYVLPAGTDTHAIEPTISIATSSPGEVATYIYIR
jgi:hypothetical protein